MKRLEISAEEVALVRENAESLSWITRRAQSENR